jgi:hypothetical protein
MLPYSQQFCNAFPALAIPLWQGPELTKACRRDHRRWVVAVWHPRGLVGSVRIRRSQPGVCLSLYACPHPIRMSPARLAHCSAPWCGLPTGEVPRTYGRSPPVPMGEVLPYLWEKSPVPMGEVLPYLREKSPVPMGEIMPYNLLLFEGLGPRDFQTDFQRRHTHTHNRVCAAQHERGCKGNRRCANLPGQPYQGYPVRPN